MLNTIVLFLFVFTIVAVAHEFGHFLMAKLSGIRVHEAGIGFGPKLFSFTRGETTYSINLVPILAFVNIAETKSEGKDKDTPESEKYYSKPIWRRFLVSFMGSGNNIILAFLILTFIFMFAGVPKDISNIIEKITPGSPAEKIGLRSGDKILSVNGIPVTSMEKAIESIHNSGGRELSLSVDRNGEKMGYKVKAEYNKRLKVWLIGFTPLPIYVKVNPLMSVYYGAQQTLAMIIMMFVILWQLITGAISVGELAGPVGIAHITGKYAESGLLVFLHFLAFININIGVLNLLPIPAFDGGRILFLFIEWVRRKPVPVEFENRVHQWGLIALLGLMALITYNDILRILRQR